MKTCPACKMGTYNTHADGRFKRGYCERCAYETEELSGEMDRTPQPTIDRPLTGKPRIKKLKE